MRKKYVRLTEPSKLEIQRRYLTEYTTQKELALEYSISIATLKRIVIGLHRHDVNGPIIFEKDGKEYSFYENDDFWRRDSKISLDRLGELGTWDTYDEDEDEDEDEDDVYITLDDFPDEIEDDEFWHGMVEDDYSENSFP